MKIAIGNNTITSASVYLVDRLPQEGGFTVHDWAVICALDSDVQVCDQYDTDRLGSTSPVVIPAGHTATLTRLASGDGYTYSRWAVDISVTEEARPDAASIARCLDWDLVEFVADRLGSLYSVEGGLDDATTRRAIMRGEYLASRLATEYEGRRP